MGLCTLSWGYISCLIFGLIPQLQSLSTLPYHTSFYFLFLVLFSYCCSTLYLPLSVSHLSPSPLVYCLSLCVSRLKQYLSSLWVETLLSSFVLLFSVQQVETDLLGWNNTPLYFLGSPVPSVGLLWHSLPPVQLLSSHEVFQVLVISLNLKDMLSSLQVMSPLFQCPNDCQHLFIMGVIISFHCIQGLGLESTRMPFTIFS